MKKFILIFLPFLIIALSIIFYKYNQKPVFTSDSEYYINKKLGIKFKYGLYTDGKITTQHNKIQYKPNGHDYIKFIEVYSKKSNQTIENAILDIIKSKGKDVNNCKIVNDGQRTYYDETKGEKITIPYTIYYIDLANHNIKYTYEEQKRINNGKKEGKDVVVFDTADYIKKEIYNQRLIDLCSDYADPFGLATSVTLPSRFIFDNKNKFVFLPGTGDPTFYDINSVKLLD
jgi:hypothetical protein